MKDVVEVERPPPVALPLLGWRVVRVIATAVASAEVGGGGEAAGGGNAG